MGKRKDSEDGDGCRHLPSDGCTPGGGSQEAGGVCPSVNWYSVSTFSSWASDRGEYCRLKLGQSIWRGDR